MTLNLDQKHYDVIIIGGGATGLGAAVDAASRGLSTLLLERADFAQATSSRSTKLIHGGVRYLKQGNIHLVLEALHERGLLIKNAPHLIAHRPFLVPSYKWWENSFYGIGLKIYDLLAGKLGIEPSYHVNIQDTIEAIPTLDPQGLRGATIYYDGQFDDSRLAITLALSAQNLGATVLNYTQVCKFLKNKETITGVAIQNSLTAETAEVFGKVIINATGIFTDQIIALDDPKSPKMIAPSQGVHLVLPQAFLPGDTALLIPKTSDGRVLFAIPWHERVLVGTTDTPKSKPEMEPIASEEEIDFILENVSQYLSIHPTKADVLSVFAGLRPLVKEEESLDSQKMARDHKIIISKSGLITIAGGKWTTYRKMGEDVIDKAIAYKNLPFAKSQTENLKLHGYQENLNPNHFLSVYGSNIVKLEAILKEDSQFSEPLGKDLPYLFGEVVYGCRHEMAKTLEDVLSRRTRSLLLDAKQTQKIAPQIASIMAKELKKDKEWEKNQVSQFTSLCENYQV